MALSDLAVFSEYAYEAATQVVAQQVVLFNEASQGTFIQRAADHTGDYSDVAFWKRLSGLVRRRNAYGDGNIPEVNFSQLTETMVKIAAGSPVVRLDPGQFRWINQDPEARGAAMGQQLGQDMVRDMFNTGLGALVSSHSQVSTLVVDKTAEDDGIQQVCHCRLHLQRPVDALAPSACSSIEIQVPFKQCCHLISRLCTLQCKETNGLC